MSGCVVAKATGRDPSLTNILTSLSCDDFAPWYAFFDQHPDVLKQLIVAWEHHGFEGSASNRLFHTTASMINRLPWQTNTMNDNTYYTTYFDDTIKQLNTVVTKMQMSQDYNVFGIVTFFITHRALLECLRFLNQEKTTRFYTNVCEHLYERIPILIKKLRRIYELYYLSQMGIE